jgi:hypothetical protein
MITLPIQEITEGHVVRGTDGQWWRVTRTDVNLPTKTVVLYTHLDGDRKRRGWLQGAIGDLREVRR